MTSHTDTQGEQDSQPKQEIEKILDLYAHFGADDVMNYITKTNAINRFAALIELASVRARLDELSRAFVSPDRTIWVRLDGVGHPSTRLNDRIATLKAQLTQLEGKGEKS